MPSLAEKFSTNIEQILGKNEITKIGVAVSGGADSVALLYLLYEWNRHKNLEITVFTVDHNLRKDSKLETRYVRELAEKLKCHFVLLDWKNETTSSGLQAKAREARYSMMEKFCRKLHIPLLLTGHHLDDMLETYLMKKSKKAGNMALAPNVTYFYKNLWIVRPLFDISKEELIQYLKMNNTEWFEDASNTLDKYERNKVRKVISAMSFEKKNVLLQEYNLANSKAKKESAMLIQAIGEGVSIYNEGFAKIGLQQFASLSHNIKIQLFNYILTVISGKTIVPRYRSLAKLLSSIADGTLKNFTLNHCKIISKNGILLIHKEKAFVTNISISLSKKRIKWDNRFELIYHNTQEKTTPNYIISNLTMNDYIKLKKVINLTKLAQISDNNHKTILFTLPVIKHLEKVVAIPHISYYDSDLSSDSIHVIFKPDFTSRFTHFFQGP